MKIAEVQKVRKFTTSKSKFSYPADFLVHSNPNSGKNPKIPTRTFPLYLRTIFPLLEWYGTFFSPHFSENLISPQKSTVQERQKALCLFFRPSENIHSTLSNPESKSLGGTSYSAHLGLLASLFIPFAGGVGLRCWRIDNGRRAMRSATATKARFLDRSWHSGNARKWEPSCNHRFPIETSATSRIRPFFRGTIGKSSLEASHVTRPCFGGWGAGGRGRLFEGGGERVRGPAESHEDCRASPCGPPAINTRRGVESKREGGNQESAKLCTRQFRGHRWPSPKCLAIGAQSAFVPRRVMQIETCGCDASSPRQLEPLKSTLSPSVAKRAKLR